jgi:hypothetical protein
MEKSLSDVVTEELGEKVEGMQEDYSAGGMGSSSSNLIELLKSPTGEGPIEDYINQPLNFDNSKGMAQVLRGLTGLLGSLNYAVIDIVLGTFAWAREKRGGTGA